MGDEADADWQDGLVEWGIEDAESSLTRGDLRVEYLRKQLLKAKKAMGKLANRVDQAERAERNMALEAARLRSALTQFVAACDTAPPTSLMIEIGMACDVARRALSPSEGAKTP